MTKTIKHFLLKIKTKSKSKMSAKIKTESGHATLQKKIKDKYKASFFNEGVNQIKSNQITFIVTSPQHKCLGE